MPWNDKKPEKFNLNWNKYKINKKYFRSCLSRFLKLFHKKSLYLGLIILIKITF